MNIFESTRQLETKENSLRYQVQALDDARRRYFFDEQSQRVKDPDTYAVLNWFFIGGIHHFYLRQYGLFLGEVCCLVLAVIALSIGIAFGWFLVAMLLLVELPQLFYAQKIVRQYNYHISTQILCEAREKALVRR